uniref:Protein kinase domain-containing protein n=1 Tax=Ganoderma boninense TaxID=34458 RepID=A0A5K1K3R5_9APHY|nr:Protein kinase domain-containing protein [Ganoderma boninense]
MHIPGKYDLWAIRLLSITLFVPPMCGSDIRNSTSSTWLPLPIKMPRQGVRAILDTASMNTTLPPSVIQAMCSLWFQMGGLPVDAPIRHASTDKFAGHRLLFTFADADDGEEIPFYCDATYFLGQLWDDALFPGLRWSHVRSSNDEECDVAVLGQYLQNFFWSAFVKFNAPYHGSPDSVPSIQLSPQKVFVEGRAADGPWSYSFTNLE